MDLEDTIQKHCKSKEFENLRWLEEYIFLKVYQPQHWFFAFLYLIMYGNCSRNSIHLACLLLSLCCVTSRSDITNSNKIK